MNRRPWSGTLSSQGFPPSFWYLGRKTGDDHPQTFQRDAERLLTIGADEQVLGVDGEAAVAQCGVAYELSQQQGVGTPDEIARSRQGIMDPEIRSTR